MVSDTELIGDINVASVSLNPCSNGIWSLTNGRCNSAKESASLNPCSNGIWSLTNSFITIIKSHI